MPGTSLLRVFVFLIICSAVAWSAPSDALAVSDGPTARRLLGRADPEAAPRFDTGRGGPRVTAASLAMVPALTGAGNTNREVSRGGLVAALDGDTALFFDLSHEMDPETETWQGSAGLAISW